MPNTNYGACPPDTLQWRLTRVDVYGVPTPDTRTLWRTTHCAEGRWHYGINRCNCPGEFAGGEHHDYTRRDYATEFVDCTQSQLAPAYVEEQRRYRGITTHWIDNNTRPPTYRAIMRAHGAVSFDSGAPIQPLAVEQTRVERYEHRGSRTGRWSAQTAQELRGQRAEFTILDDLGADLTNEQLAYVQEMYQRAQARLQRDAVLGAAEFPSAEQRARAAVQRASWKAKLKRDITPMPLPG